MRKIGFLWFPFFHWAVYRREHARAPEGPVILVREGRVIGVSPELQECGLIGLTPGKAQGRCPEARLAASDPLLCARAAEEWLEVLPRISPVIEPRGEDGAFFDLSGCDARKEIKRLQKTLEGNGLGPAIAGVGRSKFIARAAALLAGCTDSSRLRRRAFLAVFVEPEKEAGFLEKVPLALDESLSSRARRRLTALGFENYGQLRELDEGRLAQLLGVDWYAVYQHSRGLDTEPLLGLYPPEKIAVSLGFEGPVADRTVIGKALKEGGEQLARFLSERHKAGRVLRVVLQGENRTWEAERHVPWGCQTGERLEKVMEGLLEGALSGLNQAVTGLVLEISGLYEERWAEQDLFLPSRKSERPERDLEAVVQALREKFPQAVLPGLEIERRERVLALWDPWRWEGAR